MDETEQSVDAVNSSALDVLSCGLGAAVLLFMILSVVRSQPKESGSVEEYVTVEFRVKQSSHALVTPLVKVPGQTKPIRIPLLAVDRTTGRFDPSSRKDGVSVDDMNHLAASATGAYDLLGFALEGDYRASYQEAGEDRVFRLHISGPNPGEWQIGARYFNNDSTATGGQFGRKVPVTVTVVTRKQSFEFATEMEYGGQVLGKSFNIDPP